MIFNLNKIQKLTNSKCVFIKVYTDKFRYQIRKRSIAIPREEDNVYTFFWFSGIYPLWYLFWMAKITESIAFFGCLLRNQALTCSSIIDSFFLLFCRLFFYRLVFLVIYCLCVCLIMYFKFSFYIQFPIVLFWRFQSEQSTQCHLDIYLLTSFLKF